MDLLGSLLWITGMLALMFPERFGAWIARIKRGFENEKRNKTESR